MIRVRALVLLTIFPVLESFMWSVKRLMGTRLLQDGARQYRSEPMPSGWVLFASHIDCFNATRAEKGRTSFSTSTMGIDWCLAASEAARHASATARPMYIS